MAVLLFLNGYLTIFGLIVAGVGSVVQIFEPEAGADMSQTGLGLAGLGATRKGVKQFKGL
jgi:hypothetical protein